MELFRWPDGYPYFIILQMYRIYLSQVRHVRRVLRIIVATVLLINLAIVLPFATAPRASVTIQAESSQLPGENLVLPRPIETLTPVSRASSVNPKLQAAIDGWLAAHGGKVAVTVRGIDDPKIAASSHGSDRMQTASIYKLFAIELAYDRVNTGRWDSTQGGLNIDQCVRMMIVVSDNSCAVAFGQMLGWQSTNSELVAKGYPGSSLNIGGPWSTTDDVVALLIKLQQGKLASEAQTAAIISHMKVQIYRNGIPAANSGLAVADKVGFYGSVNTDAGIVYGPQGAYALAIMTDGSSFANIADLSAVIAGVLNN